MKKIIFSFIIAFMISLPYASAERLVDMGPEQFYQEFREWDTRYDINFAEYTEVKKISKDSGVYFFGIRDWDGEIIGIFLGTTPKGDILDIVIHSSRSKSSVVCALAEKTLGITGDEAKKMKNTRKLIDKNTSGSKVWINSLNRFIEFKVVSNTDGTINVGYRNAE